MSETEILEATNKIDEQGQKWILCCNDKEINSIAEDRIFYIDRCHDDYFTETYKTKNWSTQNNESAE